MLPDVRWGRSQRIVSSRVYAVYYYFFWIISKDEPCTLDSLVVKLTLSQAMFAISSAY